MGRRAHTRLSALKFRLAPKFGDPPPVKDPELAELQQLYTQCYLTVFGRPPPDRLDQRPKVLERLEAACQEAGCTLRMFVLASMVGHRETQQAQKFYANMLLGPFAVKRALRYREACSREFGAFDLQSLELLTAAATQNLQQRLLNSEILAGQWVVGYKLRFDGPYGPRFYQEEELKLDPYWLATEGTYFELVLRENLAQPTKNSALARHRFKVGRLLVELKKNARGGGAYAKAMFQLREAAAPEAVRRVLARYGLQPDDFTSKDQVVTDMLAFWGDLALALKNYFVARYLDGDSTVLNYLRAK